jgi:hypothetical protein
MDSLCRRICDQQKRERRKLSWNDSDFHLLANSVIRP